MIPRYQRIAYYCLAGAILLMLLVLLRGCVHTHERVLAMRDQSPIAAPIDSPDEQVEIATASDADGSITLDQITLPLPSEPGVRARILLDRLLTNYALPGSAHPLPGVGTAVSDVFFVPLPLRNPADNGSSSPSTTPFGLAPTDIPLTERSNQTPYGADHPAGDLLAVVNLTKAFADAHPSGIEAEDLTLRSVLATLHSNFPQVSEVRFLVDGRSRETLAGHADLSRPYAVSDPTHSIHTLAADGSAE